VNAIPKVQDLERAYGVRWCEVADLEPQAQRLLWRARSVGAGCGGWSDVDRIFSPLRNELAELLGWGGRHRNHPVLGSFGAYQVAYWKLYEAIVGLLPRLPEASRQPSLAGVP
jgi:hypothetical protein